MHLFLLHFIFYFFFHFFLLKKLSNLILKVIDENNSFDRGSNDEMRLEMSGDENDDVDVTDAEEQIESTKIMNIRSDDSDPKPGEEIIMTVLVPKVKPENSEDYVWIQTPQQTSPSPLYNIKHLDYSQVIIIFLNFNFLLCSWKNL